MVPVTSLCLQPAWQSEAAVRIEKEHFFNLSDKEAQARRTAKFASETSSWKSKLVKLAVGNSIFIFNSWKKLSASNKGHTNSYQWYNFIACTYYKSCLVGFGSVRNRHLL
jgi:hypothetical protein